MSVSLSLADPTERDPRRAVALTSDADMVDFRRGLDHYVAGRWRDDRWKTFRLRYGIYEQRQSGQHMVRAKLPAGRIDFDQARAAARANAHHAGGSIHLTTRQALQFYFLPLDRLPAFLEALHRGGITTREASGNTFRNVTACTLAQTCSHRRVDAAQVAECLAASWLRHPLVQHMPRKFKTTVSGCAHDCALSTIDDLGFVAIERDGRPGFRVVAGGGLGIQPRRAAPIFDFVEEADLPAVQEAFARVHHAYSNRANKNRARIKFLVGRFGEDAFRVLIHEAFENVRALPHRPWPTLTWRTPREEDAAAPVPSQPRGVVAHGDGTVSAIVEVPLGLIDSTRMEILADRAEDLGATGFMLTRDQNLVVRALPESALDALERGVLDLGLALSSDTAPLNKLVACPGTSTCPIGITDSRALAETLTEGRTAFVGLPDVRLHLSGCHNACGQHHIADIGLHGLAKKIDGRPAPHYQFHLGATAQGYALAGPVVPARRARAAIRRLLANMAETRQAGESVRAWAERLGKEKITSIVATAPRLNDSLDVGTNAPFVAPETSAGECAAAAVVAEYLTDLATSAREDAERFMRVGRISEATRSLRRALDLPAQRVLAIAGETGGGDALGAVRSLWEHDRSLIAALDEAETTLSRSCADGRPEAALPSLVRWNDAANGAVERILANVSGFLGEEKRA